MKFVIVTIAALISLSAKADIPMPAAIKLQHFGVKSSKIDPAHSKRPGQVELSINHAAQIVKLQIENRFYCPEGRVCAMVMPQPTLVELPIVSTKEDGCGVKTIIAKEDQRPVDGGLSEIKIQDTTSMKCRMFLESKASYVTAHYDRMEGKQIVNKSTFVLKSIQKEEQVRTYVLTEGYQANSGYEQPRSGSITLGETSISLNINMFLNCPTDRPCPRYMPAPIVAKLEIVEVQQSFCGDRIVARASRGTTVQEIVVTDYTRAMCEIVINNVIKAEYTETTYGINPAAAHVRKLDLSFN